MHPVLIVILLTLCPQADASFQEGIEELIRRWKSDRPQDRDDAIRELLLHWNELDAQTILPLLRDPNRDFRRAAANVLGWRGDGPSSEEILPLLGHDDERVRARGAWELGWVDAGDHAERILPLLKDRSALVRTAAAEALAEMGAAEHAQYLLPLLEDEDDGVREAAIWGLGWMGAGDYAESVLPLLKDKGAVVRAAAADALMGMDAREHAETIIPLLEDRDGMVREKAGEALGWIASPEEAKKLRPFLVDKREEVRKAAVRAMTGISRRKDAERILGMMKETTERGFWRLVLARSHSMRLAGMILPLLKDDEEWFRRIGVEELLRLPSNRMCLRDRMQWARKLRHMERARDRRVRLAASVVLIALGRKPVSRQREVLDELYRDERADCFLRITLSDAMARLYENEAYGKLTRVLDLKNAIVSVDDLKRMLDESGLELEGDQAVIPKGRYISGVRTSALRVLQGCSADAKAIVPKGMKVRMMRPRDAMKYWRDRLGRRG